MISNIAFADDTSKFLLMLAILTLALNSVSFFFIRLLPPNSTCSAQYEHSDSQILRRPKNGRSTNGEEQGIESESRKFSESSNRGRAEETDGETQETSSLLSRSSDSRLDYEGEGKSEEVDVRGLALLRKSEFWQLFLVFGLLTGIGLMNIK